MEPLTFALIAAFILGFGVVSGRLQRTVITPPMVFVAFGLLLSNRLLGLVELELESEFINVVAELTLILILFTDASRIDLNLLRREHDIPVRLLAIGLPLSIVTGSLVALLLFDVLAFWEAVVLAIVLAPTDAALGQAVVSSSRVPVRIRQALNVESGLNDGVALPILLFSVSLAAAAEGLDYIFWGRFAATQIILGPLVGVAVGYIGGWLVFWSENREWMAESFQKLVALGLSLLAFALAELLGGNGFIAAFCAGLTLGNVFPSVCKRLYVFAESEGQLLTLVTFMLYGAIMVFPALDHLDGTVILYALLSLTVIRMVPVSLSLLGLGLHWQSHFFLGWFGPRGIASIIYGLIIVEEGKLAERETIFMVMVVTVLLSILAHGLTSLPAAAWYGAKAEALKEEPARPEIQSVTEMPLRLGHH